MKEIKWVQTADALPLERFRPHPRNPKIHSVEQHSDFRLSGPNRHLGRFAGG